MTNCMSVAQIQEKSLDMLSFFNEYASKNNITYYMAGGTLLGAVRHKGFIPWDDDVDLMIPRDDYEKLIKTFSNDRYCISCCENNQDYNTPFARLWDKETELNWQLVKDKNIGVFIDLFPIDGFPNGNVETRLHLYHIKFIKTLLNVSIRIKFREGEKFKFVKHCLKKLIRRNGNYYAKLINLISRKYPFSDSQYVGVKTTTEHLFKERNNKNIFDKTTWIPFENLILPAPAGYDTYLRHLYGDYMQLPPEEKRKSVHYFTIREKRPNNEGKSKSSSNIM